MIIQKFNETIDTWIMELDKLSEAQLLKKPAPDSWSLGQLYQHLIDETTWYNGQIEVSLDDTENSHVETTAQARALFENGAFPDELIKGDPMIAENVQQPGSKKELKESLAKLKADTNQIWSRMQTAKTFGKSEHPGVGFLDCYEWIKYSEMHMRHHFKQKRRIEDFSAKC